MKAKWGVITIVLIAVITMFAGVTQAVVDQYGGIALCPLKPYRFSEVHPNPDFIYLNPPVNTLSQSWFQVQWINNGTNTAYDVTATISCYPPGITSTDPTVYIGTIGPGASVWSSDDFDQIIDTTYNTLNKGVCWQVSYRDELYNQYVVTDVAKFCGEDCCDICDCTVIELNSFTAVAANSRVNITWDTAAERDNIGFNIYRAESTDGNYIKINKDLIPAAGSIAQGAAYKYVDTSAKNRRTYYYKLEDVDLFGKSTFNGPISATPRLLSGILKYFKFNY